MRVLVTGAGDPPVPFLDASTPGSANNVTGDKRRMAVDYRTLGTPEQIESNALAADRSLDESALLLIDEVAPPTERPA